MDSLACSHLVLSGDILGLPYVCEIRAGQDPVAGAAFANRLFTSSGIGSL